MEKTRAQSDLPVWRKIQKTLQNLPPYIYGHFWRVFAYLIFVIFRTRAKFWEIKIYTPIIKIVCVSPGQVKDDIYGRGGVQGG